MKQLNRTWIIRHGLYIPEGLSIIAPEGVNIPPSHKQGEEVVDSKGTKYLVVNNGGTVIRI